jgi:RNA polymerase sigma-70 factor (ECF subfamily)
MDPAAALVRRCQTPGEHREQAFHDLHERFAPRVYQACYRRTRNAADAMEAAQAAFVTAFRHIETFNFRSLFWTWLYRIAMNRSVDVLRNARRTLSLQAVRDPEDGWCPHEEVMDERSLPPDVELGSSELVFLVRQAIQRVSPRLREVARLRYVEEYTYPEIAKALGISLGTVKSRISRARAVLRQRLAALHERTSPQDPIERSLAS